MSEPTDIGKFVYVEVVFTILVLFRERTTLSALNFNADGIYSINGMRTGKLTKGINIVVKDGKATKVVVK